MRILFVGEHPLGYSGNSLMMNSILDQVDRDKHEISCFVGYEPDQITGDLFALNVPITAGAGEVPDGDYWGRDKLLRLIASTEIDLLMMIGLDIWRYVSIFKSIDKLRQDKGFKWAALFPYDLQTVRKDWLAWIKVLDFPYVYSQYGENLLKPHLPNIKYFRPPHRFMKRYVALSDKEKKDARHLFFPTVPEDRFVLGYVGANQHRKDVHRQVKAFMEAKKEVPDMSMYLHTEMKAEFNLQQYFSDLGAKEGDVICKLPNTFYPLSKMIEMYSAIDCLINCSIQEGLGWTPLEAMLCGTPVIASNSTAHIEMIGNGGICVPASEEAYVILPTESGDSWIEGKRCSIDDMKDAIILMATDVNFRLICAMNAQGRALGWMKEESNINNLLEEVEYESKHKIKIEKRKAILFAQHSAAGDVLMSTQCFKGIKERHPNMPLVYMTQKQFQGVVEGNPYIDEIIDWNPEETYRYEVIYNPHGEKILPGGWNNLDTKLADMYPYFCKVEADGMFINPVEIEERLPDEYIVVHTTGGVPKYRTYRHMDLVIKDVGLPVIQIGGVTDLVCRSATMDFRGKLTWREAAWVMWRAKAAVVVDSFVSHLAGCLQTPVIVLYGPAPARVVSPIGQGVIINLEPNKLDVCPILSSCWGHKEHDPCDSPCINTINPLMVRRTLQDLLKGE